MRPPSSPFDVVRLPRRSAPLGFAAGLAGVAAALALTHLLRPYTSETVFLVPFMAAVVLGTWFGGLAPGLVTVGVSFLVNQYYFGPPSHTWEVSSGSLIRLFIFAVVGVFVVLLLESRNRAVLQREEQRRWLHVTMASAGDGLVVTDAAGSVAFLNPIAERITGWTAAEARGRLLRDILHIVNETTGERVPDPVGKVLATGAVVGLANHTVLQTRDGRQVPIDDSAAPVVGPDGEIRGVVLLFRDVSERRGIERRLAEQADGLRQRAALVEQALDPIFARGLDRRIVFWNKASETLYGWTAEEAVGQNAHELLRTEFPQSVEAVENRLILTGVWDGEIVHTCRDGRRIVEESRHVLVHDDEGRGRIILEMNRDITARRRAEDERERALREAREANRLKDEFLTTLSHELRTPLNAILGWSQILLQASIDEETTRRALRTIARNAEAQSQLIADVLDVSRIVSGKLRITVQRVDVARLSAESLDSVRPAAEGKGIELRQDIAPESLWLRADPDRLQQILWNLLTNAIKFTPPGGTVTLRVAAGDSTVRISVVDTGVGITADFLPRVFERFSQRDSSTTRVHGGLGLGLAIVRHLAEAHGGTVWAESEGENLGATFTVALPVQPEQEQVAAERGEQLALGGAALDADARLTGVRVLVVDDEEDARDLVRQVLTSHGADVTSVHSTEAAMAEMEKARFDLLLADVGMPGEDGYSLIKRVRDLAPEAGGNTAALAVTAYGRPEDRFKALAAGFQRHLAKPASPDELLAAVSTLVGRRQRT
jgi:PAS domain S-box-containing protein